MKATEVGAPNKRTVFLTHSSVNSQQTRDFATFLRLYGTDRFSIIRSEEIVPGTRWFDDIIASIKSSNVLLFLLFGNETNLDWCIFEAGVAAGIQSIDNRNLVCVIHPQAVPPPSPLEHYQNIPLNRNAPEPISKLLKWMFEDINPEICPGGAHHDKAVGRILEIFESAPPTGRDIVTELDKRIDFQLTAEQSRNLMATGSLHDDVTVVGRHGSLDIFGYSEPFSSQAHRWSDIRQQLKDIESEARIEGGATGWADHLGKLLRVAAGNKNAAGGVRIADGLPFFCDLQTRVLFRPTLYEVLRRNNGELKFSLSFVSLPPELVARPTGPLEIITHLMDLCRLFRWGILENERFRPLRKGDRKVPDSLFGELELALANIRSDVRSRGIKPEDIPEAFPRSTWRCRDRPKILAALSESRIAAEQVRGAIKTKNGEAVCAALHSLARINRSFFEICVRHVGRHVRKLEL